MISVIIPCFNLEKYISRAIESIINQTYTNWEIILIDDGSTDQSSSVCEGYANYYCDKIKLIRQENSGVSVARNNALKYIKGRYVCFLDGDDYLGKECFQKVIDKFSENKKLDICAYGFQDVDEDGIISGKYEESRVYPEKTLNASDAFMLKCMRKIWICTGSCVYKTSLIKDNNIKYSHGYKYGEDINFINKCISYSNEIEYIEEIFLSCLSRQGSATRSGINSGYIHAAQLNRKLYNEIIRREDILVEDKEKMVIACNIDYVHVITASAKNIVENLGVVSVLKANKLYKEFNIISDNIEISGIKNNISKAKLLEWILFCRCKFLFFYCVKIFRKIKG